MCKTFILCSEEVRLMECMVVLTHRCNLACSYCCAGRVRVDGRDADEEHLDAVRRYVERLCREGESPSVVFTGGEPSLVPHHISYLVDALQGCASSFRMFTNGTLLDRLPEDVLDGLDVVMVGIDGDRRAHEKHRGAGTYDRILSGMRRLRGRRTYVMGRITVEEETDLFESVTKAAECADGVYWQIVNKPAFVDARRFAERYERGMEKLLDWWVERLKGGVIVDLVPFLAVVSARLFGHDNGVPSFRCGAGGRLQVIDLDGRVYWCDEFVGDTAYALGDIYRCPPGRCDVRHTDLFDDCRRCPVERVCLGRCRKMMVKYDPSHVREYCRMTLSLVRLVDARLGDIERALREQDRLSLERFYAAPMCTEEMP